MIQRLFELAWVGLASVFGVVAYYSSAPWHVLLVFAAIGGAGFAAWLFNDALLCGKDPKRLRLLLSVVCLYLWYLVLFALIATGVFVTLSISFWVVGLLTEEGGLFEIPSTQVRTIAPILIGAMTGLVGAAFFEDAKKPGSPFWPGPMFKAHLAKVYGGHPHIKGRTTPALFQLLYYDTGSAKIKGWGFWMSVLRAWHITAEMPSVPARDQA